MICPDCKIEYEVYYTECAVCGKKLIEKQDNTNRAIFFRKFGQTSAKSAISALYFLFLLPFLYLSVLFGKYLYLNNMYSKSISYMRDGQRWYTSEQVNHLPLGIFGGIIFFIVASLVWKILCELLIIIFGAIETYIRNYNS